MNTKYMNMKNMCCRMCCRMCRPMADRTMQRNKLFLADFEKVQ